MPNVKIKNYLDEEVTYSNVNKVWLTRDGGGQETLFAEQTVAFEAISDSLYATAVVVETIFSVGDTVTVKFDDTEYTCVASSVEGMTVAGNTFLGGVGEDTGEPFLIGAFSDDVDGTFLEIATTLSGDSHVLAILKATGGGSSLVPFTYGELVENAQISLDFSGGNQQISVPDGSLVKEATILKPANLTPENIKQGVDIAGVSGQYVPETEVSTVTLDFSSGDMTVQPSTGKTFSRVDIPKPSTLVPENIAKDVTIAGVTGTHEGGGGGGATEPYVEYITNESGNIKKATLYGFTAIPSSMFSGQTGLEEVDLSHSPGIKSIGNSAFYNCQGLKSIVIPDSVTSIGYSAFYFCRNLTSIVIPDGVTSIGSETFKNCYLLTSVTIGSSVTSIGYQAFYACYSLASITIPSSVTSIGSSAFGLCYKLIEVCNLSPLAITAGSSANGYVGYYAKNVYTATDGSTKLFTNADGYMFYEDDICYLVDYTGSETALTLPVNCKGKNYEIYSYAFYYDNILTSVVIPDSVTSIGDEAFNECDKLTSVTIGDGVTTIGGNAFRGCDKLTSVTIGSSVTSIGQYAFYTYNSKLTSATFRDTTTWYVTKTKGASSGTTLSSSSLANTSTAATYLKSTYYQYYWYKT